MLPLLISWQVVLAASFVASASAFSHPPPSWDQLRAVPSLSDRPPRPVYRDSLPEDGHHRQRGALPVLYRDADCVCAASETVWLAMECKNVEYLTVLVSEGEGDDGDDRAVPRIEWPNDDAGDDGAETETETQPETDPVRLLEQIQSRYPDRFPHFYPKISLAVDASRCHIMRLPGVMPRNSEPRLMSPAPFLFREDGTLVKRSSHAVSLEELEEMQEEYYQGPFLCGKEVAAADMVWAPYLERYAVQLPLLFPDEDACDPRSREYDEVSVWYKAMEQMPAYACQVQGDAKHWRATLEHVLPPSDEEGALKLPPVPNRQGWWTRDIPGGEALWREYKAGALPRPWLADTPGGEAASFLMGDRDRVVARAAEGMGVPPDVADGALREVVRALADWKMGGESADGEGDDAGAEAAEGLSENGRQMARLACDMIEVPKDMGMIPALALWELVQSTLQ